MLSKFYRRYRSRRDFESLEQIERHAKKMCERSPDRIAMAHKRHCFTHMRSAQPFHFRYHARLHLQHVLAPGNSRKASYAVVSLPTSVCFQIIDFLSGPLAVVEFVERLGYPYLEFPGRCEGSCRLPRPFERAAVNRVRLRQAWD